MRGLTYPLPFHALMPQVFPAYAGVNLCKIPKCEQHHSIPRVCGGEPSAGVCMLWAEKYSPRMRG